MPPEGLTENAAQTKAFDVFSAGVLLIEARPSNFFEVLQEYGVMLPQLPRFSRRLRSLDHGSWFRYTRSIIHRPAHKSVPASLIYATT